MTLTGKGPIAMICPFWPPKYGGAEQYHYRFAGELIRAGFDVKVFCGTAAVDGRDNGDIAAERYAPGEDIGFASWQNVMNERSVQSIRRLSLHFAFMDKAAAFCRQHRVKVALIGNPLQWVENFHARELYLRLKEAGIKVGLFHHDLSPTVSTTLRNVYLKEPGGWDNARAKLQKNYRIISARRHVTDWATHLGSPMLFEPDFIIANSQWSADFIDPPGRCPKLVLHPLMDEAHWSALPAPAPELTPVDVLMVNPQSRKNPELMKQVILAGKGKRRHRVLKGSWGRAFEVFRPMLGAHPAGAGPHVELVDYVSDMRQAYRAAGLLLFPSFEEGYGMAAAEAMYCGTPVVSSNYPPILEAIGDGAYALCPYKDGPETWIGAVEEVLAAPQRWRARALERARQLSARQAEEVRTVTRFLAGAM